MTNILDNAALAASRPVAVLDRAALAHAVNIAALAVEKRNYIPILSNLMLTGTGESMSITGTDLDIEIRATIPGAADSRLSVTVPAHLLKDILAKSRASELASIDHVAALEAEEILTACVDMGGVRFNLQALPPADYPVFNFTAAHSFEIAGADLVAMLDKTKFSISTEETRYYLNGIFLHYVKPGQLRAVSTDGHRLAMMTVEAPEGCAAMPGVIVPRKAVLLVLKVLDVIRKASGKGAAAPMVSIDVGAMPKDDTNPERQAIRFTIGGIVITSKVIDGTFPDYERVVPRHNDKRASFAVAAMADAVNQVSLISPDKGRAVKLELSAGTCRFSVNNPDAGTAETTIAAAYDGEAVEIGFNSRYVLDVLAEIGGDDVAVSLNDHASPALFHDPADSRFTAVLMPMRT